MHALKAPALRVHGCDFTVNVPVASAHWLKPSRAHLAQADGPLARNFPHAEQQRYHVGRDKRENLLDLTPLPSVNDTSHRAAGDLINDYRARRAFEEEERAQRRRIQLEEQRSDLNPPDVRIRAWEKVHGLRMPADSTHPILEVIATDTRLTLVEVRAEQQARVAEATRRKQQKAGALTPASE